MCWGWGTGYRQLWEKVGPPPHPLLWAALGWLPCASAAHPFPLLSVGYYGNEGVHVGCAWEHVSTQLILPEVSTVLAVESSAAPGAVDSTEPYPSSLLGLHFLLSCFFTNVFIPF